MQEVTGGRSVNLALARVNQAVTDHRRQLDRAASRYHSDVSRVMTDLHHEIVGGPLWPRSPEPLVDPRFEGGVRR